MSLGLALLSFCIYFLYFIYFFPGPLNALWASALLRYLLVPVARPGFERAYGARKSSPGSVSAAAHVRIRLSAPPGAALSTPTHRSLSDALVSLDAVAGGCWALPMRRAGFLMTSAGCRWVCRRSPPSSAVFRATRRYGWHLQAECSASLGTRRDRQGE